MLRQFPPMGVYETLFAFAAATGRTMGEAGTHPWAQGYPLTTPVPDGPELPDHVRFTASDLKYPQAAGHPELRAAIARAYQDAYGARITPEHVAVFAGGRPAILAILTFLEPDVSIAVEETEYTPYYDMLQHLGRPHRWIPSHAGNRFRPTLAEHDLAPCEGTRRLFLVKSNPCNPTGVTLAGAELHALVEHWTQAGRGALLDEAYEFFNDPEPDSALRHVPSIDDTDLFVVGAATKGLQVPGARVGWVVAARRHIELLRNFSSIGMGGVARPSQLLVTKLLEPARLRHARRAVNTFYTAQRRRYAVGLQQLGFELFSGTGGFYHWARLPGTLTAEAFNRRLFGEAAAMLPGPLCDMARRRGPDGPLARFVRFSFGPLPPESYERDISLIRHALEDDSG